MELGGNSRAKAWGSGGAEALGVVAWSLVSLAPGKERWSYQVGRALSPGSPGCISEVLLFLKGGGGGGSKWYDLCSRKLAHRSLTKE